MPKTLVCIICIAKKKKIFNGRFTLRTVCKSDSFFCSTNSRRIESNQAYNHLTELCYNIFSCESLSATRLLFDANTIKFNVSVHYAHLSLRCVLYKWFHSLWSSLATLDGKLKNQQINPMITQGALTHIFINPIRLTFKKHNKITKNSQG